MRVVRWLLLQAVRNQPTQLIEALEGWHRIDNFAGEYLDHHVTRDAAAHLSGQSTEAGVPGATWHPSTPSPALVSLTSNGTHVTSSL